MLDTLKGPCMATDTELNRCLPADALAIAAYIIAFIDRTNIWPGQAAPEADLGLSAATPRFGCRVVLPGVLAVRVPSNLIIHRVGARLWITGSW